MVLGEIRVHDSFFSGVRFDGREEVRFFVVVVRVHHFVEALAVNEEVGDVGYLGELVVLQGDGVEGAEHGVVDAGHAGCYFYCFFGDLCALVAEL
jgi:hypothetical protein